ncbi:UNVERIFIED_CONTAM: hypothetical protein K2H54_051172 [Gekko kuhli]
MQDFRDVPFFKEELVDEPVLDLGRQFQFSQNETDVDKEAWEMYEFLKPPVKDLGENQEMLVDEEYYVDHDYYDCVATDIKELALSTEVDFDTAGQWAKELERIKMPELSHVMDIAAEKPHHCISRKENRPEENTNSSSLLPGASAKYNQTNNMLDIQEMNTETESDHKDPLCNNTDLKIAEKSKLKSEDCDFSSSQNSALSRGLSSELPEREEGEGEETPVFSHWGPPQTVEIFRDPHVSLGISIVGGHTVIKRLKNGEQLKGIFIKQVLEDSPAGRTKALKTGDKILEVSGIDLQNATHEEAVEAIKNAGNPIVFVVQSLSTLPRIVSVINPKKNKDHSNEDIAGENEKAQRASRLTRQLPQRLPVLYHWPGSGSAQAVGSVAVRCLAALTRAAAPLPQVCLDSNMWGQRPPLPMIRAVAPLVTVWQESCRRGTGSSLLLPAILVPVELARVAGAALPGGP